MYIRYDVPVNQPVLVALMRRMKQQHGVTIVIVTHDLELAEQANRVARLTDGRVAFDDSLRSRKVGSQQRPRRMTAAWLIDTR